MFGIRSRFCGQIFEKAKSKIMRGRLRIYELVIDQAKFHVRADPWHNCPLLMLLDFGMLRQYEIHAGV